MSRLKKVALVGRPNVGKSALFNAICRKRVSIVDPHEGLTRDRLYKEVDFFGYPFLLIDTGGIDNRSHDLITKAILEQTKYAIDEADAIIFVVDGKVGPQDLDQEIAHRLLAKAKKPIYLAVNKVDSESELSLFHSFALLGLKEGCAVSALQHFQLTELLELATSTFDKTALPEIEKEKSASKVAIVGRPNVGKSTLFNAIIGEKRSLVSPIACTTRDSIDLQMTFGEKEFVFIDTAGIRKRNKEKEAFEKFAFIRTCEAIERADIVLLVIDAMTGISTEEKKIASYIEEKEKGCIVLLNKWDLNQGFRMEHCRRALETEHPFLKHAPKFFISAKTGRNVEKIIPAIINCEESYRRRITTGKLNKCLSTAMQEVHPSMIGQRRLRIYYLTQVAAEPPRFILFVNDPKLLDLSYKKYLINKIREEFSFFGVPLILELRGKEERRRRRHHAHPISGDRDLPQAELLED